MRPYLLSQVGVLTSDVTNATSSLKPLKNDTSTKDFWLTIFYQKKVLRLGRLSL